MCVQTPSSCTIWRYRKRAWAVSVLLFSIPANPLCARGFSIMIFNTPTLNSDRGISSSACQRADITFIRAGCSGWNVETFSKEHIYRRKELRCDARLSRNLPGLPCVSSLSTTEQPRFVLDKKGKWTCAAVKEISCVVWIASDVRWTANTHFWG